MNEAFPLTSSSSPSSSSSSSSSSPSMRNSLKTTQHTGAPNKRTTRRSSLTMFFQEHDQKVVQLSHDLEEKKHEEPKKVAATPLLDRALWTWEKILVYKECRKNHAASLGGYALDGCREFMPAGEEGTGASLNCAACSCHRNFHRKEIENECYTRDCSSISTTAK